MKQLAVGVRPTCTDRATPGSTSRSRQLGDALSRRSLPGVSVIGRSANVFYLIAFLNFFLLPFGTEAHVRSDFLYCFLESDELPAHQVQKLRVRGHFVNRQAETSLILYGDEEGCFLQHGHGQKVAIEVGDYAWFEGKCRDPESGLDHALVQTAAGKYGQLSFWSVRQSAQEQLKMEYEEFWPPADLAEEARRRYVSADGLCLWRERKQGRDLFREALSALGVENEPKGVLSLGAGAIDMPSRRLKEETVLKWLLALEAIEPPVLRFEAPRYASQRERDTWMVLQVLGNHMCHEPGVVLLLDRRGRTWRAIYDVRAGCARAFIDPLRDMFVRGNTLFFRVCCSMWGDYVSYALDLRSNRATPVRNSDFGGLEVWELVSEPRNPRIVDIRSEIDPKPTARQD